MADSLNPSKHVSDVRGASSIPVIKTEVTAQQHETPDFQGTFQKYAEATNRLSAIGAHVAQVSSNQIASTLGYEEGKNPHGELTPSFTDFDKTFAESYKTQAHATLALQGEKLLDDAQVEMAKPNRLSPQLIEKTHAQLQMGLAKIAEHAPLEIRSQLEQQFQSQVLRQTTQYKEKMFAQQKQDTTDNINNGISIANKNAYDFAASGDFKASLAQVEIAKRAANSGHASGYISAHEATVAKETAEQGHLSGRWTHLAVKAYEQGRLAEFMKVYAEETHGMTPTQHAIAGQAINTQINFLKGLNAESQNIKTVQFEEEIAQNVNSITAQRIAELKNQVSPLQYEKLQLEYIKQKKIFNNEKAGSDALISGFSDANVFARATADQKNKAFDALVNRHMQTMQQQGASVGIDEAQAQVAASAAGAVPGYVNVLNAKLASANPADIEVAGRSIAYLTQRNKGANLSGLNDQANAMYAMYQALRRSMIPQEAAQEAYKAVYNQTPDEKKIVEDYWSSDLKTIKDKGRINYFTDLGDIDKDNLVDPLGYVEQAESILHANYVLTKGDLDTAKKMTAQAIKSTYGETNINGKKQTTFYPLENAVGIPSDGAGYIQDDIIGFVNTQLESTKKAFDAGASPFYYEVEQRQSLDSAKATKTGFSNPSTTIVSQFETPVERFEHPSELKIHKHWKNGTRETFPLIVKADPWLSKSANPSHPYTAGWDIVLGTPNGYVPLSRENPLMGDYIVYKPDVEKIKAAYIKNHGLRN